MVQTYAGLNSSRYSLQQNKNHDTDLCPTLTALMLLATVFSSHMAVTCVQSMFLTKLLQHTKAHDIHLCWSQTAHARPCRRTKLVIQTYAGLGSSCDPLQQIKAHDTDLCSGLNSSCTSLQ